MEPKTLQVEYHSDTPELTDALKAKIENKIERLSRGNRDITGASVAVSTDSGDTQPREYRVRIVLYKRPSNVAAIEKGSSITTVVTRALNVLERQVREHRDKRRDNKKRSA